jgi:hypothetical protein
MGHLISKGGNAQSGHELFVSENKQLTQPLMNQTGSNLGVSATNMKDVSAGALGGLDFQGAMDLLEKITPQSKPIDKNMLGLLYFTDLAKRASEPGATLFGSAAGALQSPTAYLVKRREEERKRKAAMPTQALTLATALGKTGTLKNYEITSPEGTKQTKLLDSKQAINLQNQGFTLNEVKSTTSSKPFPVKISNEEEFKKIFPNTTIPDNKIISITSTEFDQLPMGTVNLFDKPTAGTEFERMFTRVNDIGNRIANNEEVSQAEINEYSTKYQKLVIGGEFTEIVDGKEITRIRPGIDLESTTNLPIPEGLELDKILKEKAQKFDQNQTKSASFGSKMLYAEGIILNVMAQGYVPTIEDVAGYALRPKLGLGTIGASTLARQYHNAAQAWVAAQLRDESGAAIGPTEYSNALRDYFPQVGDDAQTIANKRALREATVSGMINSAGDAFDVMYPGARKFMTFTDGDETYNILNPQGYANELLEKAQLGQTIYFKQSVETMDIDELTEMLANPNAETIYTIEMLKIIRDQIKKLKEN